MITPILKDPKAHGGTLYTFPSASRDLTRAFSNSEYEFAFSHFACLNIPDFRYGIFEDGDLKGMYLDNINPNGIDKSNGNFNHCLKWQLQSYVMNFETALINGFSLDSGKYDSEIMRTPSERIFFNWLQKVGAMKFNGSGKETLDGYGDDVNIGYETLGSVSELETKDRTKSYRIGNKLYTWKGGQWRSRVLVSKTVQYIGTIDMINNVNIDFDSFNEIYLNIPANVGGSTEVYFNNIADANYEFGEVIDVDKDEFCENPEYIIGRIPEDLMLSDDDKASLSAIYDSYEGHSYTIENGYCIDFNDSRYSGGIEGMNANSTEDFEFNCVLIYYRIRRGNGEWFTNLYGVLFLEEVTISDYNVNLNDEDERGGYIQRYPKFKKGNSWGLKLDLKIDAQPDSQLELRDREYTDTKDMVGMQMFSEVLVQLNDCTKIFYEVRSANVAIEDRLYKLESIVSGADSMYELSENVSTLRTQVEMFQPTLNSLSGEYESLDGRASKLESNLGYLIRDFKEMKNSTDERIRGLESKISNLEESLNSLMELLK